MSSVVLSVIYSLSLLAARLLGATIMDLSEFIPQEEQIAVSYLDNGTGVIVQSHTYPQQSGSVKLRFKISPAYQTKEKDDSCFQDPFFFSFCQEYGIDDVTYSLDFAFYDRKKIEDFFSYCQKMIAEEAAYTPADPSDAFLDEERLSIAVVGDFDESEMLSLIQEYFGCISYGKSFTEAEKEYLESSSYSSEPDFKFTMNYPFKLKSVNTLADLKDQWVYVLLQELFVKRIEKKVGELGFECNFSDSVLFMPGLGFTFSGDSSYESFLDLFSVLLAEMENVRRWGFTQIELDDVKVNAIKNLYLVNESFGLCSYDGLMASYYLECSRSEDSSVSFRYFLNASEYLISSITKEDILEKASSVYESEIDDESEADFEVPIPITKGKIEELMQKFSLPNWEYDSQKESIFSYAFTLNKNEEFEGSFELAKPLERNPFSGVTMMTQQGAPGTADAVDAESLELFFTLPIDDKEKELISTIITTMAEKNILRLGLMRKTMEKKGKKIHHVHPFRFLGYVFSNPHLKSSMHKIRKNGFKWDGFIDGFSKKMKEEANKDNLMRYVPGFCHFLNINQADVIHYIKKRDFEGLVKFLL